MLQTGGGAYYNRCPAMAWTGNLFENNTAKSGSAGLELNQCAGDVRQSVFFKNRVRCLAKPLATQEQGALPRKAPGHSRTGCAALQNPLPIPFPMSLNPLTVSWSLIMHDTMLTECLQPCLFFTLSCKHLRREGR